MTSPDARPGSDAATSSPTVPGEGAGAREGAGESVAAAPLPHPLTGELFTSPVAPGTGWPGDPVDPGQDAPVPARSAGGVRRLARGAASLADLDARVSVCRACPRLVRWREDVALAKRAAFADQPYWGRPVPSFGDPDAHLLVLGLAPAANGANRTGRMFTGDRSGDVLFAALHRAGLAALPTSVHAGDGQELRGARMVAPVHCAPPANKPTAGEKATCGAWLDRELELLANLRAVLALGSIAWTAALSAADRAGWSVPRPRPRFGHGAEAVLEARGGHRVRLVGSYHVSQQNTFTGRLTPDMLDAAIARATAAS